MSTWEQFMKKISLVRLGKNWLDYLHCSLFQHPIFNSVPFQDGPVCRNDIFPIFFRKKRKGWPFISRYQSAVFNPITCLSDPRCIIERIRDLTNYYHFNLIIDKVYFVTYYWRHFFFCFYRKSIFETDINAIVNKNTF